MNLNFSFERKDHVIIFSLKNPNLDMEISAQLKAKLLILCQPDVEALVFDLSNIEYVDSSGLGSLLLAYRQMKEYGSPIALVGVKDMVRKMLNISQIEDLYEYYDSIDEAVQSFN
jgi:anti-sigma B factor antagonist